MTEEDDIWWSSATFNATWGVVYDSSPVPWHKRLLNWLLRRRRNPLIAFIELEDKKEE